VLSSDDIVAKLLAAEKRRQEDAKRAYEGKKPVKITGKHYKLEELAFDKVRFDNASKQWLDYDLDVTQNDEHTWRARITKRVGGESEYELEVSDTDISCRCPDFSNRCRRAKKFCKHLLIAASIEDIQDLDARVERWKQT